MSNKSTTKTPCQVQDSEEMEENIPPGFTIVQLEEVQQNIEKCGKGPVQSTPSCDGGSQNSRISGFNSALTPILKFLNIGKSRQSNEALKNANNPLFSFGNGGAVAQKSNSSQASVKWYESDPDITLLELTCNSTMPLSRIDSPQSDSGPQAPLSAMEMTIEEQVVDVNLNNMSPCGTPNVEVSGRLSPGEKLQSSESTQEISLQHSLKKSRLSFEQTTAGEERDITSQNSTEELSSTLTGNITKDKTSITDKSLMEKTEGNVEKRLEVTQDLFVDCGPENGRHSLESDERLAASTAACGHPANVTHDLNLPSETSALHTESKSSSSHNGSVKNVTLDLHVEVPESATVNLTHSIHEIAESDLHRQNQTFESKVVDEAIPVNTTAELSCPKNVTMDLTTNHGAQTQDIETISLGTSTSSFSKNDCGACGLNGTMDILPPNVSSSSVKNEVPVDSICSTRSSPTKESDVCEAKVTFESEVQPEPSKEGKENVSPSKMSSCSVADTQNITFESKTSVKTNTTVTIPEAEPCSKHQLTYDMASPQSSSNSSSCPKSDEASTSKCANQVEESAPSVKASTVLPTESVAQDSPARNTTSVTDTPSALSQKDPLQRSLSDSLGLHTTGTNRANVFNLDDSLDLKSDYMVTSTPMVDCKTFSFTDRRDERKVAQKTLYGECSSRPAAQPASETASNIVGDRKTFLPQPGSKPSWPNSKTLSQPTRSKPTSALPGRSESLMSRLPLTRQRTQVEVMSTPLTSEASQECAGKPGPYILRSTVAGSKLSNTGLPKPQASHIGSGIQRAGLGLRPLSARNHASAQSSNKPPSTAVPVIPKTVVTKKHPLAPRETLPTAKKQKTEFPNRTEASVPSSDVTSRAKMLRQPLTVQRTLPAKMDDSRGQGESVASRDSASRSKFQKQSCQVCANCVVLEQQLKIKCEELERLKAELLKYNRREDC